MVNVNWDNIIRNNYYEILEVSPNASIEVIQVAYRKLSRKYHSDNKVTGNEEKMKKLNETYEFLSNPEMRKEYDLRRKQKESEAKEKARKETEAREKTRKGTEARYEDLKKTYLYLKETSPQPYKPRSALGIPSQSLWKEEDNHIELCKMLENGFISMGSYKNAPALANECRVMAKKIHDYYVERHKEIALEEKYRDLLAQKNMLKIELKGKIVYIKDTLRIIRLRDEFRGLEDYQNALALAKEFDNMLKKSRLGRRWRF